MALLDGIARQLRSVIQWENPQPSILFYRWTDNGDEIKNASKLIVGPGQGCIFVYEGKVRGVFLRECMINLKTDNLPFWTTISKVLQAFQSEHKVGLYFFRQTLMLNQKWGTTSSIKYEEPVYKFPIGLKVYGNYSFRIIEPRMFFETIVGSSSLFTLNDLREIINNRILQPLSDYFAEKKYGYVTIDAQREEIATTMKARLTPLFTHLGFALSDFRIEGTSFDEDTLRRINRIADMSAEAQASAAAGITYAQMQQLEIMRDAAHNEGGAAGVGMGFGIGIGAGQLLGNTMVNTITPNQPQNKEPASANDPIVKLKILKQMFSEGLITEADYTEKKQQILNLL